MNNDVELIPVKGVLPSVQVQSDNVIYVPQAHKNKAGIVKEGDGVLIENGVVSLNRQTVEDMIDANKWVSYGFKQNLTEDEKGMARHNIGAGDNYFTGSYYDLTQKPHLNTNNTTGLDYGDEELNDTINLHKISKTGSFNDLKHVPQETLDFAESERQKSKNLFNANDVIFDNSTYGYIPIKNVDSLYTLSLQNDRGGNLESISFGVCKDPTSASSVTEQGYFWLINGGNKIVNADTSNITNKPYVFFYPKNQHTLDLVLARFDVQIEEGSVATEYQPYNGAIVHEKEIADVEHIEVLYDKSSSDANINKGLTSGCQFNETSGSSVSLENSSTSKYKGLNVYVYAVNQTLKVYLPVDKASTVITCRTSFAGQNGAVSDSNILYGSLKYVYGNLYPASIRERTLSSEEIYQNNSSYYVSKVEGVY